MAESIVSLMSKKVNPEWLQEQTRGGRTFSYIPIDKVIRTLNENFKDEWNVEITEMHTVPGPNIGFVMSVRLTIRNTVRYGTGADIHKPGRSGNNPVDPDKIVKTAYANAIKKAANMFGLGLELWDEDNAVVPHSNVEVEDLPHDVQESTEKPKEQKKLDEGHNPPPAEDTPQPTPPPENKPDEKKEESKKKDRLSDKSREKISMLKTDTGLIGEELSEYLKSYYPESGGDPTWLTIGEEDKNVDEFVNKIKQDLAKKQSA